ncbi:MAG: hypothetical protein BWX66_02093 [Deltaproteobacteria bacterium ADurb.Bin058]|nr:MAG: hypothetical protein BWX66_02093 [Deltaproteobacteria bacterium ADurb.Bin058]
MPIKAASATTSGVPAIVTTVRFAAAPISTSKSTAPAASIASVMALITSGFLPSEKLGTHSTNLVIFTPLLLRVLGLDRHQAA